MTLRDYADEPFGMAPEAQWHGPAAQRKLKQVALSDKPEEPEQDPHHV